MFIILTFVQLVFVVLCGYQVSYWAGELLAAEAPMDAVAFTILPAFMAGFCLMGTAYFALNHWQRR